jgi:hypothetical protein
LIDREDLVENDKIKDDEDGIEIANSADLFFINHADRGAEGFVGNGEKGIGIADCVGFFLVSYADRGAVSPHSTNFVVVIVTTETANMY